MPDLKIAMAKVPEFRLAVCAIKVAATVLGEAAGHIVTMSVRLGYLVGRLSAPAYWFGSVCRKAATFWMSSLVSPCATTFITLPSGRSSVRWNTFSCLTT